MPEIKWISIINSILASIERGLHDPHYCVIRFLFESLKSPRSIANIQKSIIDKFKIKPMKLIVFLKIIIIIV